MRKSGWVVVLLAACTTPSGDGDGGATDAGGQLDSGNNELDAGHDAGQLDAGMIDAGHDAGQLDAGMIDAGQIDAGPSDAGVPDSGIVDAGFDAGQPGQLTGSVSDGGYAFADQHAGTSSTAFGWSVTNSADQPSGALTVSKSGATPDQFSFTSTCASALGGMQSCVVSITFSPTTIGPKSALFTVSGSPGGSTSLAVTGNGAYALTVQINGTGAISTSDGKLTACTSNCVALYIASANPTLTAVTQNGGGSFFTGWDISGCDGPVRDCAYQLTGDSTVTATFAPLTANLAFASSTLVASDGGMTAANSDALCNALATDAGLNNDAGTAYIAWLSAGTDVAINRVPSTARGWVRLDGRMLADTQASFMTETSPAWVNPVKFDERGNTIVDDQEYFTGTFVDMTKSKDCTEWTGVGYSCVGDARGASGAWTWDDTPGCDFVTQARLLCLMTTQTSAVTLPAAPSGSKRLFITAALNPPSATSLPDARCSAELAGSKAFVAYSTATAASLLSPNTTYVRPDGAVIGTGAQIAAGNIETPITQRIDGTYVTALNVQYVPFTGSSSVSATVTTASTCSDWTATTGNAFSGNANNASNHWWSYGNGSCAAARPFYCIEQ